MDTTFLKKQLELEERYCRYPYEDIRGILTIGIGRNLRDNGISRREAEFMLDNDIRNADLALDRILPWYQDLDDMRKTVLLDLSINMGVGGVLKFKKMLAALARKDYKEAAAQLIDSLWAKQVQKTRVERLKFEMQTGQLPVLPA